MRLSTLGFATGTTNAMMAQSSSLAKLQNQIALGTRVQTPADDPIAAVHIIELERAQAAAEQYEKNSTLAQNRLNLEEQSMSDVTNVLTRVRELMIQAGNVGTLSNSDRESIATELAARLDELQDIANRQDGNGEYLFSGYSTKTKPFDGGNGSQVTYIGDQGSRMLALSPTQKVADSHNGFDMFMNITEGNGTFATAVNPANTGSGAIDVGSIVNRTNWVPDDYTITFTSATAYQITDGATPANVVSTGAYTAGQPIQFNGVSVTVTGAPAVGDSFSVNQAGTKDIFATVQGVVTALQTPAGTPASNAKLASALQGSLQQLDQATDHLLGKRAEIGVRLGTLESSDATREATNIDLAASLSDLKDLDYAQALTKMNQQLVGLQAAQLSYSKISGLSLFNYLR